MLLPHPTSTDVVRVFGGVSELVSVELVELTEVLATVLSCFLAHGLCGKRHLAKLCGRTACKGNLRSRKKVSYLPDVT